MCVECVLAVLCCEIWIALMWQGQKTNWTCTALIGCELVRDRWRLTGNNTQLTVSANEDEINYSDYLIKAQFTQMTKDSQSHFSLRQLVYFCTQHPLPYIDNLIYLRSYYQKYNYYFCSVFLFLVLYCMHRELCCLVFSNNNFWFDLICFAEIWLLKWDCTTQQHRSYSVALMCHVIKLL